MSCLQAEDMSVAGNQSDGCNMFKSWAAVLQVPSEPRRGAAHCIDWGALLRTGPDQVKIVPRSAAPGQRRRLRATEGSTILDIQLQPSPGAVRDEILPSPYMSDARMLLSYAMFI